MGADVVAWLQVLAASPKPTFWTNSKGQHRTWTLEMPWPIPTTFSFDTMVEAATEAWQFAHNLLADGVVGPMTWAAGGIAPTTESLPPFALVKGTDTSVIQGKLPVQAMVKEGITFGWARCKVGNNLGRDTVFEWVMRAFADAGILRGGYCFLFPLKHLDPIDQAKLFLDAMLVDGDIVGTRQGELPLAVDLEWPPPEEWAKWGCTPDQIVDFALALLTYLEEQTGQKSVIYSYPYFLQSICKATNYAKLLRYKLWLAGGAQYMNGNGKWPDLTTYRVPSVPGWGTDWLFNQWDGNGGKRLPGSNVDADFNIFRYDLAVLKKYCQAQLIEQDPDTLPDMSTIFQATSNLIVEDGIHAYRQERANAFIAQPV